MLMPKLWPSGFRRDGSIHHRSIVLASHGLTPGVLVQEEDFVQAPMSGGKIVTALSAAISARMRESSDSIDAGFHYITKKSKIKIGFTSRTVFDGVNTDKKFWVGGFVEFPFQFGKSSSEASSE